MPAIGNSNQTKAGHTASLCDSNINFKQQSMVCSELREGHLFLFMIAQLTGQAKLCDNEKKNLAKLQSTSDLKTSALKSVLHSLQV